MLPEIRQKEFGKPDEKQVYDLIIIGNGVAGLAGAMYAARLGMETLVIGEFIGGTLTLTDTVENYPGFKHITGIELTDKIADHARQYDVDMELDDVTSVEKSDCCFIVKTPAKAFKSETLLFATGARHRELVVPNIENFKNKGVHYCALCDGFFYKGKTVGVVGGGDSALKEAIHLAEFAKKVYMFVKGDKLRGENINLERIMGDKTFQIVYGTSLQKVDGTARLESVTLDKEVNGSKTVKLDGMFVAIGYVPNSELAKKLGARLNEKGEIVIDRYGGTSLDGVYAAGDVSDSQFKQAITGVGEAVNAVYDAFTYLNEHEFVYTCIDPTYIHMKSGIHLTEEMKKVQEK
ncbi:thioredoxin reductase [Candidatus Micrarchaeota archaeon CG06_land_8_20_14_3_00_50_6]|nr:MAG: thioredoxin reductase [Candidatus Micrarchaeota archaeon CG06_land_8_20_14_3_00_50_6]